MNKHNVFVVDDSSTMRKLIADALEQRGYAVQSAPSMELALQKLAHFRSGIVMVDIFMPGMNGVDGIGIVNTRWPDLPIIAMSGGTKGTTPVDALTAARVMGADVVMQKPFEIDEMVATVDALVKERLRDDQPRKRVLVVDDSATILKLVGQFLAERDYQVAVADSVEAAISSPDIVGIDIVITDIFMPGIGGIEGIAIYHDHWPNCRIIAMSAGFTGRMSSGNSLLAASKMGADKILTKPFTKDELFGLLDGLG